MRAEFAIAMMFTAAVLWGVIAYFQHRGRARASAERRGAGAGLGSPDQRAASLLRELIAGTISAAEARERWPEGVSEPAAVTYLDYFDQGLDHQGMRDPGFDAVVAGLADRLERRAKR
ncbi:hypothetical protein PPSIR1_11390 [Plesiocystis pacifica SIR-1]|uniref:Uncharacterized protein n=1 Tax=Plesiocystis pacifica SIR-1 TaxID=391625 RepID=A6G181_9BACT|nr:hypothetical protein [Plesiocystis pacifica]EDM80376.1 hypothetical protein PPSIR1_11390 [Plesiocystis pacifica SIR-1]